MRERLRRWLIRAAWAGLIACACVWLGLQLGRPLYYTDGARERFGLELLEAPVLRWPTPVPEWELPGPVHGRVAALADGRLVYGRAGADGDVDLVVFDPSRPSLPPEPLSMCNTRHHELAPALGPDGALWFSSDRPGGRGGYDLWRAARVGNGFAAPEPAPKGNTALDETDPALAPDGVELVFARIDRELRDGRNGELLHTRLDDEFDPEPLFPRGPAAAAVSAVPPEDRDPCFAPDGRSLWFVRRTADAPARLVRAVRHLGAYDAPAAVLREWGTGELRSPWFAADGFALRLLRPDATALVYRSDAEALQPWWPGQRGIELLLLVGFLFCAVLLLLLYLGRRWRQLDLVTLCLLLSLLLHLLLLLWLLPLEIVRGFLPGPDDAGGLQVQLVSEAPSGGGGADGGGDLASEARFRPETRELSAASPGAELARAAAAAARREGPTGEWQSATPAERDGPSAALADAAEPAPARAGTDAAGSLAAAALAAADQARATPLQAARAATDRGGEVVQVTVPGADVPALPTEQRAARSGPAGSLPAAPPAQAAKDSGGAPDAVAVQDAPAAAALPAPAGGSDAPTAVTARTLAAVGPSVEAAAGMPQRTTAATPAAAGGGLEVQTPGSALAPARGERAPVAAAAPAALPVARGGSPEPVLRDRAEPSSGAGSPATPATDAAPTGVTAPALGEVAAQSGGDHAAPPRPASSGGAVVAGGPALPDTGLPSGRSTRSPDRSPADSGIAATPRPLAPSPVPLRDGGPSSATAALPQSAAPAGRSDLQPVPLPALGPAAAAARPAPAAGVAPSERVAFGDLRLPGSLLERAPSQPWVMSAPPTAPATASAYSNRFGPARVQALERYGGTVETERAVADGLRYLARIQNADGSWGDRSLWDQKYGRVYVGKSALCLLAFLGAGHTHQSDTDHSGTVRLAVEHLLALQDEDGAFGATSAYGHGITTYALAECYGITKDRRLLRPVERGLSWILDHQGPRRDRRNRGGWGYFSPELRPEDDYARVSVSAWMIMALESARLSGIEVPDQALARAREYLEQSWDENNRWYRYNQKPSRLRSAWPTLPASTPAGAFGLMLLGVAAEDPLVAQAVDFTVERAPRAYRRYSDDDFVLQGQGNVYFWYYGSLCCFLAGGEAWQRWNARLKELLPAAQSDDGSWAPIDVYARYAGDTDQDRSYTTAMCVLCLEVYYRYFTPLLIGR